MVVLTGGMPANHFIGRGKNTLVGTLGESENTLERLTSNHDQEV
jgi:hypothetical protein